MEIERKFLVEEVPRVKKFKSKKIRQGYISINPEIRIRKIGRQSFLTVKSSGYLTRNEFELKLSSRQFRKVWKEAKKLHLSKTRYFIPLDNRCIAELDIYNKKLKGLITVEVEFESEETAENFERPKWFGEEVTYDNDYKNNNLVKYGIPLSYNSVL
ncbi:MAG TPA: CYTH domain-containing protein [Epulopiscium sp.]|nr:CYTH domain-containing protein [Candidatus Epulonipiscium sp.]